MLLMIIIESLHQSPSKVPLFPLLRCCICNGLGWCKLVRRSESRKQVSWCSAVSSELLHLHKAGPQWKPRQSAICSQEFSAKSVEASTVFPGVLVSWCQRFRWFNRECFRGEHCSGFSGSSKCAMMPPL